ncbi:uncharacterized protein LOC134803066 [Cydia splendana]|uniref:uncharacterized protein LOC134803066 n=1 Tax=Cydia splendana TaxID=1100963 RepID=UPI00300DAB60
MEMINQCHCCLRRPPTKDMKTPYTRLGIMEIYSAMLEECFAIDVTLGYDGKSGICENCVGRLREACHFKLLVQHSQAKLRGGLESKNHVKDEEPPVVLTEEGTCEKTSLHEELIIKSECEDTDAANDEDCMPHEELIIKSECEDTDAVNDEDCMSSHNEYASRQF